MILEGNTAAPPQTADQIAASTLPNLNNLFAHLRAQYPVFPTLCHGSALKKYLSFMKP